MRIKIRPVRWWRDDATRYQSRGSYKAPPSDEPTFGPLPPLSAELLAEYDRLAKQRMAMWLPPEVIDPIADVQAGLRATALGRFGKR